MKNMFWVAGLIVLSGMSRAAMAQSEDGQPWSERAAISAIDRWPEGQFGGAGAKRTWNYELGTLLEGVEAVWLNTADARYFNYMKSAVDRLVEPDGSIPSLKAEENQLDDILMGRQLLLLYGVTQDAHYAKAAALIYQQLVHQPRNSSGGFWHKQKYPNQMWLDGLYMAEPFYAEYAATFHQPDAFNDVAHQFELLDQHARDAKTALLYHGWDESKRERWADKQTGLSSQLWARGMGWHMMALVDTLQYFPTTEASRKQLTDELESDAAAVARYQDSESGLWFQVLDKPGANGNFLEASASCMLVYALARGVREGYLAERYSANAERGYEGILKHFIETNGGGAVSLTGTVKAAGLGGEPYRDGSYSYYVGEKTVVDDPKGVGAFLLASTEMEQARDARIGRGTTVLMDAWFNSQTRVDAFGERVSFHYKWYDESNDGYSLLGHIVRNFGAKTETLYTAPSLSALSKAQVYFIASPDTVAKNPHPHVVQPEDGVHIAEWVKDGGVLILLANDPANTDLDQINLIAGQFGIHFNSVLRKHVVGNAHESGKLLVAGGGTIFRRPHELFMKDVCNMSVTSPAAVAFQDDAGVLMATAKYGKGTVFATVDPWLYNEYTDGRKLDVEYDNFAAAKELVRWILAQTPRRP